PVCCTILWQALELFLESPSLQHSDYIQGKQFLRSTGQRYRYIEIHMYHVAIATDFSNPAGPHNVITSTINHPISNITTFSAHMPFPSHYPVPDSLPALPLELQLSIFTHLAPHSLFPLRRTSHSWNIMLSNPHLLQALHSHLPFLTSARSLSSRLKRRQRMIRNSPVWVKRHTDAFPWYKEVSLEERGPPHISSTSWSLYWNGYLAALTSPGRCYAAAIVGNENTAKSSPYMYVLRIGHVSTPGKVVMVDISAILMENYPTFWHEGKGGIPSRIPPQRVRSTPNPFHFTFHEEKVLVGFWLAVPDATSSPGKTGVIIISILTASESCSLNEGPSTALSPRSPFLKLNIYSLHTCQPVSREIRIKPVDNPQSKITESQDQYLNVSMLLSGFSCDNQGTTWFPSAGWGGEVEFYAQIQNVECGEEETWVWGMSDLPKSVCGEWVAFPLVEGVREGMGKRDGIPPKRKEGKEYFEFSTHVEGIVILPGAAFKPTSSAAILTSSLQDIATIKLLPASPPEPTHEESLATPKPHPMRIIHGKWKSASTATHRKYTFLMPVDIPLNSKSSSNAQYWRQDSGAVVGESEMGSKMVWGYLVDNYFIYRARGGSGGKGWGNVYLLPYEGEEGEWVVTGCGLEEVGKRIGWGIDPSRNSPGTVSLAWGDDGLAGWWVAREMAGSIGIDFKRITVKIMDDLPRVPSVTTAPSFPIGGCLFSFLWISSWQRGDKAGPWKG
ncbi:hypothetical protein BGX38DRAFT_1283851, partial [Terfezia claveryi]